MRSLQARCVVLGLAVMTAVPPLVAAQEWQTFRRPSFPSRIQAATVWRGQLVVGGAFQSVHEVPARQVALWDGRRWVPLDSGPDLYVDAMATYRGDLVVAGHRGTTVELKRWLDPGWDLLGSFEGGFYPEIHALHVHDLDLYVGGAFTGVDGMPANGLAVWDGLQWSSPAGGTGGEVTALVSLGPDLIAAGYFTVAEGGAADRIAAWDGLDWSPLGSGLDAAPNALVEFYQELWVATDSYAWPHPGVIRRWDGVTWSEAGSGLASAAGSFAGQASLWPVVFLVREGRLYVGGSFGTGFTSPGAIAAFWNGTEWEQLGGFGGVASDFAPSWGVEAMVLYEDRVTLAGLFPYSANRPIENLTAWDGQAFVHVATDEYGLDNAVHDFQEFDGGMIAVGDFDEAGVQPSGAVAFWNGVAWRPLGASPEMRIGGRARCAIEYAQGLIVGGYLTLGDGSPAAVARWDGLSWSPLGDETTPTIYDLMEWESRIIAATDDRVREWNGTSWEVLGTGMPADARLRALKVYQGQLFAAGYQPAPSASEYTVILRRLDGDDWTDVLSRVPAPDGFLFAMEVYEGKLVVGGSFDTISTIIAGNVASWDGSEWSPLSDLSNGVVYALKSTEEGLIAGGSFDLIDGLAIEHLARYDATGSWTPYPQQPNLAVYALEPRGGSIWVGGRFSQIGERSSTCVAVWHSGPATGLDPPPTPAESSLDIWPNPFNPSTRIEFTTSAPGRVRVEIFNAAGRKVVRLLDTQRGAGAHTLIWTGLDAGGSPVASGVYLVRLDGPDGVAIRKAALVR